MATVSKWTPFGVALDITALKQTVNRISATQFTVKINAAWETYYSGAQTNYGMTASSGGKSVTLNTFGNKSSGGNGTLTGTYSISGNGSATKIINVTFKNFNNDNGDSATKTVSFIVTVPAWTSYAINYHANGGDVAPVAQTKWKDQTLKLSILKPTRTGYSFLGWATSSTATSATYSAGGNYTANAAATLYAVWKPNEYTVSYNANGGTGAPANQTKYYGSILTLSSTKPTKANYTFKGWATTANGSVAYSAGGSYTANAAVTLYAVWERTYLKPKITEFTASRCNAQGNLDDSGTYALVKFNWTTTLEVVEVLVGWNSLDGEISGTQDITASGTSGSVEVIVGNGVLATEKTFNINVAVRDSGGGLSLTKSISGLVFPIGVMQENGEYGISIGKIVELLNTLDIAWVTKLRKHLFFNNNKVIYGTKPDGTTREVFNPQNANGNTVVGYDNYTNGDGQTNIYGFDLLFGVSNTANPGTYKPYLRQGDSFNVDIGTAGYITSGCAEVTFTIPVTRPIIGSPTITAATRNGFVLRQNNAYTHGSTWTGSGYNYAIPDSYDVEYNYNHGIKITANFSNVSNATNNSPIGVHWSGTITLSQGGYYGITKRHNTKRRCYNKLSPHFIFTLNN